MKSFASAVTTGAPGQNTVFHPDGIDFADGRTGRFRVLGSTGVRGWTNASSVMNKPRQAGC